MPPLGSASNMGALNAAVGYLAALASAAGPQPLIPRGPTPTSPVPSTGPGIDWGSGVWQLESQSFGTASVFVSDHILIQGPDSLTLVAMA